MTSDDATGVTNPDPVISHRHRSGKLKRALFVLTALALATTVASLVGEVYVRMFKPQVLFPRYVTDGSFGIRVNVPNARYWHTSPEMKAEFRINSMGIRSDREFTFDKPPGTFRIVGLGDSFTQGYEVSLEDTYLYRLERLLADAGFPVEVINLGVSGHGNAEELVMLKEFGFRFQPDLVILGYFQNDLQDNVRSDLYRLDENDALVQANESYLPAVGMRDRLYAFGLFRWLAGNSHLFALVRERMAAIVKRRMVQENEALASTEPAAQDLDRDDYRQRLAARLLDRIKAECDQGGIRFILLDIPGHRLGDSNLPNELLMRISPAHIVRPVDTLRAQGSDAYLYRQRGHCHWTPRAHEIAARMLAANVHRFAKTSPR